MKITITSKKEQDELSICWWALNYALEHLGDTFETKNCGSLENAEIVIKMMNEIDSAKHEYFRKKLLQKKSEMNHTV